MTISGLKAGNYSEAKVEGSKTQADLDEYEAVTKPIENRFLEMRQSARPVDIESARAMQIEMDSLLNAYKVYTYDFIRNHPDSYFATSIFSASNWPRSILIRSRRCTTDSLRQFRPTSLW